MAERLALMGAGGKPALMRDDWKRVLDPEEIVASVKRIT